MDRDLCLIDLGDDLRGTDFGIGLSACRERQCSDHEPEGTHSCPTVAKLPPQMCKDSRHACLPRCRSRHLRPPGPCVGCHPKALCLNLQSTNVAVAKKRTCHLKALY